MPRPKKCRRICALPDGAGFAPLRPSADGPVILAVEEYEVIRLIDHLGCTQEEAAARMEVARTTVQVAALPKGSAIEIEAIVRK